MRAAQGSMLAGSATICNASRYQLPEIPIKLTCRHLKPKGVDDLPSVCEKKQCSGLSLGTAFLLSLALSLRHLSTSRGRLFAVAIRTYNNADNLVPAFDMRLLNTGDYTFKEFSDTKDIPRYAILSHTWEEEEEVAFEEMNLYVTARSRLGIKGRTPVKDAVAEEAVKDEDAENDITICHRTEAKRGFGKIEQLCSLAAARGLGYAWIDTCSINKHSSTELSESINSMFRWYERSEVCFAYLSDVSANSEDLICEHDTAFEQSRWNSRGWTLQELIAPANVLFLDRDWQPIGWKEALPIVALIQRATGIPAAVLKSKDVRGDLSRISIAARMSWASKRKTTRPEDIAYCLFGIFDIAMPLLYGEGGEKAFFRLQREIMSLSDDHSIFAWRATSATFATWRSIFAISPEEFAQCGRYVRGRATWAQPFQMTNMGLQIQLPLLLAQALIERRVGDEPSLQQPSSLQTSSALKNAKLPSDQWPGIASLTSFKRSIANVMPRKRALESQPKDVAVTSSTVLRDENQFMVFLDCYEGEGSWAPQICLRIMPCGGQDFVRVDPSETFAVDRSLDLDSTSRPTLMRFRQNSFQYFWENVRYCNRFAGVLLQTGVLKKGHSLTIVDIDKDTARAPRQQPKNTEDTLIYFDQDRLMTGAVQTFRVNHNYNPHHELGQSTSIPTNKTYDHDVTFDPGRTYPDCISIEIGRSGDPNFFKSTGEIRLIEGQAFIIMAVSPDYLQ